MENINAQYKLAVLRDDARAIESVANIAAEEGNPKLLAAIAAVAREIESIGKELTVLLDD